MHNKVIIIGSGVAGLATAIRLAVAGYQVDVYEKNDFPGGKISAFEENGFFFDWGPSLFTQPENISELFELCGEDSDDHFTFEQVNNTCRYFFTNGKVINAWSETDHFENELREVANETKSVKKYLARSSKLYHRVGEIFLNHSLNRAGTWLNKRVLKAIGYVRLSWFLNTLHQYNRRHFTSGETIKIFDRFATYNGSDPFRAPALLNVIPHLEYNTGIYFPKGGMISITAALYNLALRQGVRFHFSSPVQRIINFEGRAIGIVCDNSNIFADTVVSNADVYFTYKNLLHMRSKARKLLKQERSTSALVFYWGMSKKYADLDLHNIFFSEDYAKEFRSLSRNKLADDFTVYVNITSKREGRLAPTGMDNWFVMVNVPPDNGQDWKQIASGCREKIIKKLSHSLGEDIEPFIKSESITDPPLIEKQTGSFRGALYGSSSNTWNSAFRRHANFSPGIKGLFFCGGSVHPGGGIPLCLKSAKITANLIMEKNKPGIEQ